MNNSLKRKTDNSFFYGLTTITIFFIYHYFGSFIIWIFGVSFLGYSLLFNERKQINLLFCFVASEDIFKIIGYRYSPLGYYELLIGVIFIIRNKNNTDLTYFALCFMHFISLIFTFFHVGFFSNLFPFIRIVIDSYFIYKVWMKNSDMTDDIVKHYIFGVSISVLFGIVFCSKNGTLFSGVFGGISGNRNYFGVLTSVVVTICILYLVERKLFYKDRILFTSSLFLSLFSIMLSASRTCVIAFLFPVIVIAIELVVGERLKSLRLVALLSIIALFLCFNYFDFITFIEDRFHDDNMESGSGRYDIWNYYLSKYLHSGLGIFVGNGSSYTVFKSGELGNVAHSTPVEFIYSSGIFGCLTILAFIIYIYKRMTGINQHKITVSFFPLFNTIFCYLGIDGAYSNQLMQLLMLSFMIIASFSKYNNRRYLNEHNSN